MCRSTCFLALSIIVALPAIPVRGDILYLKDGSWVEGNVKKGEGGYTLTDAGGKIAFYRSDQIAAIELVAAKVDTEQAADSRLASLRRAMANQDDLNLIIQRYNEFLERYRNTPVAEEAGKDLAEWKQRQAQGRTKYGQQWLTAGEREKLLADSVGQVDQVRQLIQQGRQREAQAIVDKILQLDAHNVSALYLHGLLLYRQDQLPAARKAFEAVNAQSPEHAPTLNNLAVILWRQNQHLPALQRYEQAMNAAPLNKQILNNVAEALQALPANLRDHQITKRVTRRFEEQDAQLQQQMGQQGLYRWGATWVNQEQMVELKKAEAEMQRQLDDMSRQFDQVQSRIRQTDDTIQANISYLRNIESTSYLVDPGGRIVQLPYPPAYWDVARENDRLRADRQDQVRQLDQLRQAAKQVQQQLPTPKYTGLQHPVGPEGTPLPAIGPSTKPAAD